MPDDWFRKTTWTAQDSEHFFAQLMRARQPNRSQYLRIQASHLADLRTREMAENAVTLLEILFEKYPDQLEMAAAYLQKAECLVFLGRIEESLEYFKKAIDFQRTFPNIGTQAPITFGLTVIKHKCELENQTAIQILDEFEDDITSFPVDRFRISSIRAVVAKEFGDNDKARFFAREALTEAAASHSGFWKHPKLGLVGNRDVELRKELAKLAVD